MDGSKKCGGSVIADKFIVTASHCIRTCPEHCSDDWDRCAEKPTCFVKLRFALGPVWVETVGTMRSMCREYNDIEIDYETIHTIKSVSYAPSDSDIAILELHDSVNTCSEPNRDCWPITPLQLPSPGLRISPGQAVRTLGRKLLHLKCTNINYLKICPSVPDQCLRLGTLSNWRIRAHPPSRLDCEQHKQRHGLHQQWADWRGAVWRRLR